MGADRIGQRSRLHGQRKIRVAEEADPGIVPVLFLATVRVDDAAGVGGDEEAGGDFGGGERSHGVILLPP
jgi:hypothetical protein